MRHFSLRRSVYFLLFLFGVIGGLVFAKPFLVPVAFGALIAMLLLPVTQWLQGKGLPKVGAILLSLLSLLVLLAGLIWLLAWQVSDLASNSAQIEQNLTEKFEQLKQFVSRSFGITEQKQQQLLQEGQKGSGGKMGGMASGFLAGLGSFLTDFVLVLVYTFLFLYSQERLRRFALRLVQEDKREEADRIIGQCSGITHKYLTGMGMMIACLWVLYGIGFSVIGVKSALFFAILCGLLEIVPFVGNLTGTALTILASVAQGGSGTLIIGVLITYAVVQFVQTYILEPLVVGDEVNINPLFTILALVAGEAIWGIPGMILAIPAIGILKVVCDHVPPLQPYGYLLGADKRSKKKKR